MRLTYKNIVLRDFSPGDEEDMIRWMTVQTQWHQYDSPWLAEQELAAFNAENYRRMAAEYLKKPQRFGERATLQIEDRETGQHIGFVSSYYLDKNFEPLSPPEMSYRRAVGIDICEETFRGQERGTNALTLFTAYLCAHGWGTLFLQTWNGNERMMHVAEKLGFRPHRIRRDIYSRGGVCYHNLTYLLDRRRFDTLMPHTAWLKLFFQTLFR